MGRWEAASHNTRRRSHKTKMFGPTSVINGDRPCELGKEKKLSQGDIEKKTGLLRCNISRVENRHSVPNMETLERFARALEIPMYQLFHDGAEPPKLPNLLERMNIDDNL